MRTERHIVLVITLAWALCVGIAGVSGAQSTGQIEVPQGSRGGYDDRNFGFEVRNWLTAISGDVSARGKDAPIDVNFRDTLTCWTSCSSSSTATRR